MLVFIVCVIAGCDNSGIGKYDAMVKKEMDGGRREDSIFYGFYFGMTNKDFYSRCWDFNKKGIFRDGTNNMYVLYKLDHGELKYPADMNFYPDFFEGKISNMRVIYQYRAWAPWNKSLFSDSLLPDLLRLYGKLYPKGNPFIAIQDKNKAPIYVKVDGNRRITIGRYDDAKVKVAITDLINERKTLSSNGVKK